MNGYLCKKYQVVDRSIWTLWYKYPLFLMQESRAVFVVFIEIIFSHGDLFESIIKIFW